MKVIDDFCLLFQAIKFYPLMSTNICYTMLWFHLEDIVFVMADIGVEAIHLKLKYNILQYFAVIIKINIRK